MRLFFENSFSLEKQSTLYFDNNTISHFFLVIIYVSFICVGKTCIYDIELQLFSMEVYTVFKNFKKLLHIFSYVTTRGSNLIDFIYKYVRRNAYFGRRFKKINKICKVTYVYFSLFIF